MERADEKAAGGRQLYNLLEDRAGRWSAPTPYQTRRAVRAVITPYAVIHRNSLGNVRGS